MEVFERKNIEEDFQPLIKELLLNKIKTDRVIIYYRSLNLCSDLYIH